MATSFSPTPAELSIVSQIFTQADPQNLGALTGEVAVKIFGGAKLPPTILGEIWNIADEENKGWLPKKGVAIAIRLIGWAQKGEKVNRALLNKPGPLASIEGVTALSNENTGMSLPKSPAPGFPPLTPADVSKFQNIFLNAGPTNGLLSGDKARDIFIKSKLSNEKLLQIWNLADTQDRGALDVADFSIGMYFIQGLMTKQISFIPTFLPPGLLQQAAGGAGGNGIRSHPTGTSGSFSPVSSTFASNRSQIHPQWTGTGQVLQPDHTGLSSPSRVPTVPARPAPNSALRSPFATQVNSQPAQWDITVEEKAASDGFFDNLDPQRRGYIEGDIAVPFMLESRLEGEDLAQVWDLADMNNDGRLTRDGFAVAMYLIKKKLGGHDIPQVLPRSLIPPSMRSNGTSSVPTQAHADLPKDLFSFDDVPPSAVSPQATGNINVQQTGPGLPPSISNTSNRAPFQDPFASYPSAPTAHQDLLGDDDQTGTSSPPLHDQSAEIGNVTNQVNSTNRSLETTRSERSKLEQTLSEQASQLSALQTQLSSAKAAYETETKLQSTLQERLSAQNAEIKKTREELIRAESDLSGIRVEKAEIEGSFLRDKEEARDLHRRMVEVSQQIEVVKGEIERSKKEAKQQKGLLAIARKQLSTKETEKAKVDKELEVAAAEVSSITKERQDAEGELEMANVSSASAPNVERTFSGDSTGFAANHPLPVSPEIGSPISSKRNNPFDRLAKSPDVSFRSQSPFLALADQAVSTTHSEANDTILEGPTETSENVFDGNLFTSTSGNIHDKEESTEEKPSAALSPALEDLFTSPTTSTAKTDVFTPLSTSNDHSRAITPTPQASNGTASNMKAVETIFPAIEDFSASVHPDTESQPVVVETDMSTKLRELEVSDPDSDSDSDDSEDEVPLAELSATNKQRKQQTTEEQVTVRTSQEVSFDDVFGESTTSSKPLTTVAESEDKTPEVPAKEPSPFGAPVPEISSSSEPAPAPAGVHAFDEAMGMIPTTAPSSTPNFIFDSAFDDNFDFASASQTPNTITASPEVGMKRNGSTPFDTAFPSPPKDTSANRLSSVGLLPSINNGERNGTGSKIETPSFEEAFAGFGHTPNLDIAGAFPSSSASEEHPTQKPPATLTSMTTSKPVGQPPRSILLPSSPRGASSPPRVGSPKPRISSSSSGETHGKSKEPAPKHSKLSLRLPFGKKKKQQQQQQQQEEELLTTPTQYLSSHEEQVRISTPGVDDDVEPVKQLTAMGFSRSQAVDALEKYGYDVQKALNSLLGAQ